MFNILRSKIVKRRYKDGFTNNYKDLVECSNCGKPTWKWRSNLRHQKRVGCSKKCTSKNASGINSWNFAGDRAFKRGKKDGYIMFYKPDHPAANRTGRLPEHRLIMERRIGRYLKKGEFVHHVNGLKSDNRIENLFLCNSFQHLKLHQDIEAFLPDLMRRNIIGFNHKTGRYTLL